MIDVEAHDVEPEKRSQEEEMHQSSCKMKQKKHKQYYLLNLQLFLAIFQILVSFPQNFNQN